MHGSPERIGAPGRILADGELGFFAQKDGDLIEKIRARVWLKRLQTSWFPCE